MLLCVRGLLLLREEIVSGREGAPLFKRKKGGRKEGEERSEMGKREQRRGEGGGERRQKTKKVVLSPRGGQRKAAEDANKGNRRLTPPISSNLKLIRNRAEYY